MKVKVVGIGGCGRNSLNALIDLGFDRRCALNIDTDINAKSASKAQSVQHLLAKKQAKVLKLFFQQAQKCSLQSNL